MHDNNFHNRSQDQFKSDDFKELSLRRAQELEEQFESNELPPGFFFADEKLMYSSSEEKPPVYICSKLEVVAYIRDDKNENYGKLLRFKDPDNHIHEWAMPMELIAGDGTKYRAALLSRGLEISTIRGSQTLFSAYLVNSQPKIWIRCIRYLGWHNDNFVFPDSVLGLQTKEKLIFQNPNILSPHYVQKGTVKEWIDNVSRLCINNSRLEFSVSTAFASPLLHLLKAEGGGIHFKGSSSLGKSKILRAAGSVWGDESFIQRWNATLNGLEAIASGYNDTLLCLDELAQIEPLFAGETAYLLSNEKGKLRATKTGCSAEQHKWKFLFLSNGEISLDEHMQQCGKKAKGGQEVRLADIPADTGKFGCFENLHEYTTGEEFADAISTACDSFYGAVSIEYLSKIIENRQFAISFAEEIVKCFIFQNKPLKASGQVVRVLKRFAIIAAGGELATEYGLTGWIKGSAIQGVSKCFTDWLDARGGVDSKEKINALRQIKSFFSLNPHKFHKWDTALDKDSAERSSFKKYDQQGNIEFFVHPLLFRNEICSGLDAKLAATWCIEEGLILPSTDNKPTRTETVSINKVKGRYYRFTSKVIEENHL